jgi:thiamine-phosphate pyrophosphorylase
MSAPAVMLVTDRRRLSGCALPDLIRAAARAGLDFVQVREKDLAGGALLALTRAAVEATAGSGTRVLVNGRPDVALAAGAHGVQLPADGLPVAAVRAAFGTLLVGASCHSLDAARAAADAGADLLVVGPVFATPGKETRTLGAAGLAALTQAVRVPVFAIGGIDADSAVRAVAAGARGVAAIRFFLRGDAATAVHALRRACGSAAP